MVSLIAILGRPRGIPEAASSAAGALLMLASRIVPVGQAIQLLLASWNVLLFFAGLVLIAWTAEQGGFFRWAALWAVRLADGSPLRLFLNVFGLGAIISTFLSNDATALLLTPVVVTLTEETGLSSLPFAFACTFIANTASVTLPVSNPINILLLEQFHMRLGVYVAHLLAPSLAAIAFNTGLFLAVFHRRLGPAFSSKSLALPRGTVTNPRFLRYTLAGLGALSLAYLVGSLLDWPLSLVALGGAALLLLGGIGLGALKLGEVRHASWSIVPFIASLLVLVQGVENVGVTTWLAGRFMALAAHGPLAAILAATAGSAIGSNLINNVPMATVMASELRHLPAGSPALRRELVAGAIFGCDAGSNLTVIGSLSTMLWLLLLRRRGVEVTAWQYLRLGLLVTPPILPIYNICRLRA